MWLYREIETEAATVAEIAGAYIDECERSDRAPKGGGDHPPWHGTESGPMRALPGVSLDGGER